MWVFVSYSTKTELLDNDFKSASLQSESEINERIARGETVLLERFKKGKIYGLIPVTGKIGKEYTFMKNDVRINLPKPYMDRLRKRFQNPSEIANFIISKKPGIQEIIFKTPRWIHIVSIISTLILVLLFIALLPICVVSLSDKSYTGTTVHVEKTSELKVGDYVEVPLSIDASSSIVSVATNKKSGTSTTSLSTVYGLGHLESQTSVIFQLKSGDLSKKLAAKEVSFAISPKSYNLRETLRGEVKPLTAISTSSLDQEAKDDLIIDAQLLKLQAPQYFIDTKVEQSTFENTYLPLVVNIGLIIGISILLIWLKKITSDKIQQELEIIG